MRTRTTLAASLLAAGALALTACGSSSSDDSSSAASSKATSPVGTPAGKGINCSDPGLPQADWEAHCDKTAAGHADSLSKQFGQTYAWLDGVKVSVTEAKIFTDYDKSIGEKATPGTTDYEVMIKVTNGGHVPVDLSDLSVITEGATNGGEASLLPVSNAAPGLEGRLAPGVTVIKADTESLENKFGRRIVVTVQRTVPGSIELQASPEFTGSITN